MDIYNSIEEMVDTQIKKGWKKTLHSKGFTLEPTDGTATGSMSIWGDPRYACFIDSDAIFHTELMEMQYCSERGIQITLVENMDVEYYNDEKDKENSRFGVFCYVNNVPIPWFKRYPAGTVQSGLTIRIMESFFQESNINMPLNGWDRAARSINQRDMSLPALANICRQIKQSTIDDECFPMFFKAKCIESISLLLDYAFQIEQLDLCSITERSRLSVKKAIEILNDSFASPPIISDLAQIVGLNKKTLQFAFKQIVGQSIHKYVRALRMQKAIILLEDKSIKIEDISINVGYKSKIHFYNAFKNTYDCTPAEMRRTGY